MCVPKNTIHDITHNVHHQNQALRAGFSAGEFDGGDVTGFEFGGGRGRLFECLKFEDCDETRFVGSLAAFGDLPRLQHGQKQRRQRQGR
jgi:hypothetical protein